MPNLKVLLGHGPDVTRSCKISLVKDDPEKSEGHKAATCVIELVSRLGELRAGDWIKIMNEEDN